MTRKSKLYLLCMLFHCVVCLPCCGKKKNKSNLFFRQWKKEMIFCDWPITWTHLLGFSSWFCVPPDCIYKLGKHSMRKAFDYHVRYLLQLANTYLLFKYAQLSVWKHNEGTVIKVLPQNQGAFGNNTYT